MTAPFPSFSETNEAGDRRVLVVDDNEDAADSLAMLISVRGDAVRTAYDGEQAIELEESFRPGIVLLDIGLPKVSGYEVARRIRAERGNGVLIIAITGWGQAEDRDRAREAGFDHHFTKPVDFDRLIALLERLRPRDAA
jgi:DNA-binding response OmpR family regulator